MHNESFYRSLPLRKGDAMRDWLDAETRVERAAELTEAHQWAEALGELDAAIEINPHDADWHIQRGQILDQLNGTKRPSRPTSRPLRCPTIISKSRPSWPWT